MIFRCFLANIHTLSKKAAHLLWFTSQKLIMSFFQLILKTKNKNNANVVVFLFFDLGAIFFWKTENRDLHYKG
ncbi:hypothetical protein SAMN05443549_102409 [Flavobacterium fluvii]|uniref:Uncharacterized protein n=1 Tax=Flavobacterium fluvii TaxID=468056 RepID=A0A1M5HWG4_9FLAO|nr:hypothetical protein SAMN05443549_102409 [Flavobacterium fluvii]